MTIICTKSVRFSDIRLAGCCGAYRPRPHALQHRGQKRVWLPETVNFPRVEELGLVGDIFGEENVIKQLEGDMAIGHTRYSTTGKPNLRTCSVVRRSGVWWLCDRT